MGKDTHRQFDWSGNIEHLEEKIAMSADPLGGLLGGQIQHHAIVDEMPPLSHHDTALPPIEHHLADELPPLDHHLQREADFWIDPDNLAIIDGELERIEQSLANAHDQSGMTNVTNDYGFDGTGQTVAIIDSGIAYDHFALGGGLGSNYRVVGGWDFTGENDADPYDDGSAGSHGTHVAGIVGASGGTHEGVAPGVDLVGLRVFDDGGNGYFSWVENALQWVHDNKDSFENPITAVNLSLGVATWNSDSIPNWANLENEFNLLRQDGIFISVSAGNSFTNFNLPGLSYPAASPHVIPVASVDDSGLLSYYSQRNSRVIAAPGRGIMSTVPDYKGNNNGVADDYASFSGTSMAAPYVAGASVIIREAMEFVGYTNITQETIYNHMISTADSFYDSATDAYYNRLNMDAAIDALMPTDEFGSTLGSAFDLGTLNGNHSTDGVIGTLNDIDYFKFTASATGSVSFTVSNLTHDLAADWTSDTSGVWSGANNETFTIDVVAGQEYTVGFSSDDGLGYYDLDVTSEASENFTFTDWGAHSFTEINNISNTGESWYRVVANNAGYFTAQAFFDAGGNQVNLELYNSNLELITAGNPSSGESRVNTFASAGTEFYLKITGDSNDIDIRLTNLVSISGTTVSVLGTSSNDTFTFSAGSTHNLTVNGTNYAFFDASVTNFVFDGGTGSDSITIDGTSANETAVLRVGDVTFSSAEYALDADQIESVSIDGNGGSDAASFYDSTGNDLFYGFADGAVLFDQNATFYHVANGFSQVDAFATAGGIDRAYLFDSAGDDLYLGYSDSVTLRANDESYSNTAHDFERVDGYATEGGQDQARFYDTAGDDNFYGLPNYSLMQGADGSYVNYARGFDRVDAYSTLGGNDRAYLYDSAGNDLFYGLPEYAVMRDSVGQYENYAHGFSRVDARSSAGGTDRAYLYDSTGNDRFYGLPGYSAMLGENNVYFNFVEGFARVDGYSNNGGTDRAYLFDSSGDDMYYGYSDYSVIFDQSGTFYNYAHGFGRVDAFATAGGQDEAILFDGEGNDRFYGLADYGLMLGQDNSFHNKARNFEHVDARATQGGTDRAYLYDTAGDDSFYAYAGYAALTDAGSSYYNLATQFERVDARSSAGGNDSAYFYDSAGNDRFYGLPEYSAMLGENDEFYNFARGFGNVEAHSTAGGNDQAFLYDSSGNDVLQIAADHVALQGDGFRYQANGFQQTNSYASSGDDSVVVDQVYQGESLFGAGSLAQVTRGSTTQNADGFDEVTATVESGANVNVDNATIDYLYQELGA